MEAKGRRQLHSLPGSFLRESGWPQHEKPKRGVGALPWGAQNWAGWTLHSAQSCGPPVGPGLASSPTSRMVEVQGVNQVGAESCSRPLPVPGSVLPLALFVCFPHDLKMMNNGVRKSRDELLSPQNSFSSIGCPWSPIRAFPAFWEWRAWWGSLNPLVWSFSVFPGRFVLKETFSL